MYDKLGGILGVFCLRGCCYMLLQGRFYAGFGAFSGIIWAFVCCEPGQKTQRVNVFLIVFVV